MIGLKRGIFVFQPNVFRLGELSFAFDVVVLRLGEG